jgi:hypothetical protein
MKKLMSVVVGLFLASSALAGWGVGVSVNIGGPVYTPAPVVYTSPVCIPRPVYYAPVVYVPAPVVYPSPIGIVYPTPITVQFPVTYHHYHYIRH